MNRVICAGSIPFRLHSGNLEILLVRSFGKNYWECAKGHLDKLKDETLRDCAVRETKEECGIDISIIKQLKPIFVPREDEIKAIVLYTAYCLNPDEPYPKDGELAETKFFSIDDLPELDPWQKNTIYDAILGMMKEISEN